MFVDKLATAVLLSSALSVCLLCPGSSTCLASSSDTYVTTTSASAIDKSTPPKLIAGLKYIDGDSSGALVPPPAKSTSKTINELSVDANRKSIENNELADPLAASESQRLKVAHSDNELDELEQQQQQQTQTQLSERRAVSELSKAIDTLLVSPTEAKLDALKLRNTKRLASAKQRRNKLIAKASVINKDQDGVDSAPLHSQGKLSERTAAGSGADAASTAAAAAAANELGIDSDYLISKLQTLSSLVSLDGESQSAASGAYGDAGGTARSLSRDIAESEHSSRLGDDATQAADSSDDAQDSDSDSDSEPESDADLESDSEQHAKHVKGKRSHKAALAGKQQRSVKKLLDRQLKKVKLHLLQRRKQFDVMKSLFNVEQSSQADESDASSHKHQHQSRQQAAAKQTSDDTSTQTADDYVTGDKKNRARRAQGASQDKVANNNKNNKHVRGLIHYLRENPEILNSLISELSDSESGPLAALLPAGNNAVDLLSQHTPLAASKSRRSFVAAPLGVTDGKLGLPRRLDDTVDNSSSPLVVKGKQRLIDVLRERQAVNLAKIELALGAVDESQHSTRDTSLDVKHSASSEHLDEQFASGRQNSSSVDLSDELRHRQTNDNDIDDQLDGARADAASAPLSRFKNWRDVSRTEDTAGDSVSARHTQHRHSPFAEHQSRERLDDEKSLGGASLLALSEELNGSAKSSGTRHHNGPYLASSSAASASLSNSTLAVTSNKSRVGSGNESAHTDDSKRNSGDDIDSSELEPNDSDADHTNDNDNDTDSAAGAATTGSAKPRDYFAAYNNNNQQ